MAAGDKIKALRLVEKISRYKFESLGSDLGNLRAQQAELDLKQTQLTQRASEEVRQSTTDTQPYLSRYLSSVNDQQRVWEAEATALENEAAVLEAELLSAFGELKTRETIRGRAEQDQAQEVERAENAILDDAGRTLFLTNRAAQLQGS